MMSVKLPIGAHFFLVNGNNIEPKTTVDIVLLTEIVGIYVFLNLQLFPLLQLITLRNS